MAYQTYITEALVCGTQDSKSADRSYLLFTRESGMIYAHAKSVREERSKHRYALQVASHIRATLVRGRSGWKITGAEPIQNLYAQTTTRESRAFLRNTILLLRRVIHGETSHEGIFDDVVSACMHASQSPEKSLEQILLLRVLHALGYIAPQAPYTNFLHCSLPYAALETLTDTDRQKLAGIIEHALAQSHL